MKRRLLALTGLMVLFGNSALADCRIGSPRQNTDYENWGSGDLETTIWVFKVSSDPEKIDVNRTMKNLLTNGKLTSKNAVTILESSGTNSGRYRVSAPNSAGSNTILELSRYTACGDYAVFGYNPQTKKLFGQCGRQSKCHNYTNNTVTTYSLYNRVYDQNDNQIQAIAIVKEVKRLVSTPRYGSF